MPAGLFTPSHVAIVLVIALLVLGPKRLPQTGRALGHTMREFKDAITGHAGAADATPAEPAALSALTSSPAQAAAPKPGARSDP